jgi:hypothetical protein
MNKLLSNLLLIIVMFIVWTVGFTTAYILAKHFLTSPNHPMLQEIIEDGAGILGGIALLELTFWAIGRICFPHLQIKKTTDKEN